MNIYLIRESGGYGDVICTGAAALALRRERPAEDRIVLCVPEEFAEVARHLDGPDEVVSLGPLEDIRPRRRMRDWPMDPIVHTYLSEVLGRPGEREVIDLYCPGHKHEVSSQDLPTYSRSQLFAVAAGASHCLDAKPRWVVRQEEMDEARRLLDSQPAPWIVLQPRSTCPARSLSILQSSPLTLGLSETAGTVFHLDCIQPRHPLPGKTMALIGLPWPVVAAIVSQAALVVAVDSALIHLAAALDVPTLGLFGPTTGRVVTASYPLAMALEGSGVRCLQACHYHEARGWDKEFCRSTGCERMWSHKPEYMVQCAEALLKQEATPCES